ncbi:hypothetical protein K443DRAFT_585676 [Laccaria amethystina LaAM-08-1]|uniref:Uncharacterized protein n=1 Tax=Laccaria amethystina LaAM-08-1 TaxID=1095629 RepID=A0A0C9YJ88_9AGAR|nr:hypothetical protein K443DRAFT_585676 [Laccaria amethystina LaAM-08-1]
MDGNLATTYTLIHSFLRKQSHNKAADALKKAAKAIVILKDDIEIEGPQLDEIIQIWESIKQNDNTSS